MKYLKNKYCYEISLILCGMIWLLMVNFLLQISNQTYVFPDSESYLAAAKNVYLQHKSDAIRPLLIAAINGFSLLFSTKIDLFYLWNIVLNSVFWIFSIVLIFNIIAKIRTRKSAFIFSLIYMVSIGSTVLVFHVLSEIIFTFFLIATVYFIQKFLETKHLKYLAISLSILILSVLIKPVSKVLILIMIVLFFFQFIKVLKSKWVFFIIFCTSLLMAHTVNMKKNYGDFTITYIDSFTYYNYLGTRADCLKNGTEFKQCDNKRHTYFNTFSLTESKKVASNDIKEQLSSNTFNFVKAYFINVYKNSTGGCGYLGVISNKSNTYYFEKMVLLFKVLSKIQNIAFSILGFSLSLYFLAKKPRHITFVKLVAVITLYIMTLSAISSDQGDRFHVVIFPLVLILIAEFRTKKITPISEPLQK